jgi:hypothetical protein
VPCRQGQGKFDHRAGKRSSEHHLIPIWVGNRPPWYCSSEYNLYCSGSFILTHSGCGKECRVCAHKAHRPATNTPLFLQGFHVGADRVHILQRQHLFQQRHLAVCVTGLVPAKHGAQHLARNASLSIKRGQVGGLDFQCVDQETLAIASLAMAMLAMLAMLAMIGIDFFALRDNIGFHGDRGRTESTEGKCHGDRRQEVSAKHRNLSVCCYGPHPR